MFRFLHKPYRWAATYSIILLAISGLILLDTFVIPRTGTIVATAATQADGATVSSSDENIRISIDTYFKYETWIYAVDIQVSSVEYLRAAFANGTYGRNIKAATSDIAAENNAILAINGDYYGFRDYGFVLRNGVLYRSTASPSDTDDALLISNDGTFTIIQESDADADTLLAAGAWQILSFGPALIDNGEIAVNQNSEVDQSMTSNPRTAVGMISPLHYVFIVSDGRTSESAGLSLLELAQEFDEHGCSVAYNLDGGGSATLWFNGEIINNPVGGKGTAERKVSDIVYIGY